MRGLALFVALMMAAPPVAGGAVLPPVEPSGEPPSLLEAAEVGAASGAWRAQNTATITTGLIREDDKRRSAIAFALSGALALAGAGLWRWIPCRNASATDTSSTGAAKYNKCFTPDGDRRPFDPPTKYMLAAGIGLEVVSLVYLIAHLRSDDGDDPQP